MNFNTNKDLSDVFLNSIEKEKLILANDKNRINDIRERKEQQLEDIEDFNRNLQTALEPFLVSKTLILYNLI